MTIYTMAMLVITRGSNPTKNPMKNPRPAPLLSVAKSPCYPEPSRSPRQSRRRPRVSCRTPRWPGTAGGTSPDGHDLLRNREASKYAKTSLPWDVSMWKLEWMETSARHACKMLQTKQDNLQEPVVSGWISIIPPIKCFVYSNVIYIYT